MKKNFISNNFLLSNQTAVHLYHDIAKDLPIIDYHCHLPIEEIAANKKFLNLTHIWLNGDHYKWRAMRANGVDEKYCTGNASDYEKFEAWAETVPFTIRNPLYHWTHMELKKPFGIDDILLNNNSAKSVWDTCNDLLQKDEFSTRGLLKQFNVKVICTTDDPTDSLEFHRQLKDENYEVKVLPTFRPDKSMALENIQSFKVWLKKLESISNSEITNFASYLAALKLRHDFFHENGCKLSDHGIEQPFAEDYTKSEIESIFRKILKEDNLLEIEILKFKSCLLYEFGLMNHEKNWVQQFHFGA
ncbi:MAG: glucuronate isomerase, partial [Ignavibacteria bacterium]|nr:glucuronate isomerase [Ignavibacteria bacterium]